MVFAPENLQRRAKYLGEGWSFYYLTHHFESEMAISLLGGEKKRKLSLIICLRTGERWWGERVIIKTLFFMQKWKTASSSACSVCCSHGQELPLHVMPISLVWSSSCQKEHWTKRRQPATSPYRTAAGAVYPINAGNHLFSQDSTPI